MWAHEAAVQSGAVIRGVPVYIFMIIITINESNKNHKRNINGVGMVIDMVSLLT